MITVSAYSLYIYIYMYTRYMFNLKVEEIDVGFISVIIISFFISKPYDCYYLLLSTPHFGNV